MCDGFRYCSRNCSYLDYVFNNYYCLLFSGTLSNTSGGIRKHNSCTK